MARFGAGRAVTIPSQRPIASNILVTAIVMPPQSANANWIRFRDGRQFILAFKMCRCSEAIEGDCQPLQTVLQWLEPAETLRFLYIMRRLLQIVSPLPLPEIIESDGRYRQ